MLYWREPHYLFINIKITLISIVTPIFGPFGWPNLEDVQLRLPSKSGTYLMTVEHKDGYLPWGVGITRRPMRERFMEHTRSFKAGDYNILDIKSAYDGIRKVVWKGWGWTDEKRADYSSRKNEIVSLALEQLSCTRIFVIDISEPPRILERIESTLVTTLHQFGNELVDKGMLLMPRKDNEEPIAISFESTSFIYGLPANLIV